MIEAAIYGYGNIGSGVAEVIEKNQDRIEKAAGQGVHVKYVLDLREFEGDPVQEKLVHDVDVIVNDPEVKIICETMGGNEPAYTFTKKALMAGKSVCTSNKELVANHGAELIKIAEEHRCNYFFEASVGGGIPIIRTLNSALKQENILSISGIVNGTTNYILTKMEKDGAAFDEVLREAQEKGFAERNPEADVEGYDACRKIAILSSLMSGKTVDYKDIYTEGITKLTTTDFLYAEKMEMTVKLLAMSRQTQEGYLTMVTPMLIGPENPLCSVNGVFNAISVKGNMLGDSMYYGRGAGKLPTASAVVADVVEAARFMGTHLPIDWSEEKAVLAKMPLSRRRFFVRLDRNKVPEARAAAEFGNGRVVFLEQCPDEYGYITPVMSEGEFAEKFEKLDGAITRIRMEE
ncbi:homoserine dehydrogenase [bacterium 1XD8-76]|nr:homoserine dehydrogenase [bacterium 1XD8-76]